MCCQPYENSPGKGLFSIAIFLCLVAGSCISEEIVIEKYNTRSVFYSKLAGPYKNLLIICRGEGINKKRLQHFENRLKAKSARHQTAIKLITYTVADNEFKSRMMEINTSGDVDFIIRLSHFGELMPDTPIDRFPNMQQKSPFRVERMSFSLMGYHPENTEKLLWKAACFIENSSSDVADEQAANCVYNHLVKKWNYPLKKYQLLQCSQRRLRR